MSKESVSESVSSPRVCVALFFEAAAGILCVRRAKTPEAGSWSLPAGHVEFGETAECAVRREVREETGLQCLDTRFLGIYEYLLDGFHFVVLVFTCKDLVGTLGAGDDAMEVAYLTSEALSQVPSMTTLFQRARELLTSATALW